MDPPEVLSQADYRPPRGRRPAWAKQRAHEREVHRRPQGRSVFGGRHWTKGQLQQASALPTLGMRQAGGFYSQGKNGAAALRRPAAHALPIPISNPRRGIAMKNAPDEELLNAAKSALDALEYLSQGVQFNAKERLRDAIHEAEAARTSDPESLRATSLTETPCSRALTE